MTDDRMPIRRSIAAARAMACAALALCAPAVAAPGDGELEAETGFPSYEQVLREGDPIPLDAWRGMTEGRTVWYYMPDGLWGREAYLGASGPGAEGMIVFQHRDGLCMDGDWRYVAAQMLYCFDFHDGRAHCFQHLRWRSRVFALSLSGDLQEVKRIDDAPLACGPSPISVAPFTGAPRLPSFTIYASVQENTNLPLVISTCPPPKPTA